MRAGQRLNQALPPSDQPALGLLRGLERVSDLLGALVHAPSQIVKHDDTVFRGERGNDAREKEGCVLGAMRQDQRLLPSVIVVDVDANVQFLTLHFYICVLDGELVHVNARRRLPPFPLGILHMSLPALFCKSTNAQTISNGINSSVNHPTVER